MNSLSELRSKRRYYRDKVTSTTNSIRTTEDDYDALVEFKRIVEQSQGAFHSVNSGKNGILEDVAAVKTNSLAAQSYYDGMKDILSGIGSKLVMGAYAALLTGIRLKLSGYRSDIDRWELRIDDYERKIEELDRQIEEAERLAAAESNI